MESTHRWRWRNILGIIKDIKHVNNRKAKEKHSSYSFFSPQTELLDIQDFLFLADGNFTDISSSLSVHLYQHFAQNSKILNCVYLWIRFIIIIMLSECWDLIKVRQDTGGALDLEMKIWNLLGSPEICHVWNKTRLQENNQLWCGVMWCDAAPH